MGYERERPEEALRESEERFRRLTEASLEGIAIHDKGKILDANQALATMLGCELCEVVGMDGLELVAPESRDLVSRNILSGYEQPYEALCLRRGGSPFVAEFRGKAIPYDGRMLRVTSIRDITERKRAEEALRESESKFRHVLDGSRDMVYSLNLRTFMYDYLSPSCREVLGYSPEEFTALGFMGAGALVHPDDVQRVLENFAQLRTRPTVEYRFRHKELGYRWMSDSRSVVFDDKGGAAVIGALRDITERKRAQEALRESERRYRLLAENATDMIWTMDMNLRQTYASPSVTRMRGYSVEEVMGQTVEQMLTPASLEVARQVLAEELATEEMEEKDLSRSRTLELEHICKDGSTAWAEVRMTFLRDEDGWAVGILGVSRDITARKRAQRALEESERRYRLLAESASDIIWVRDLDLRAVYVNPAVTRIRGYTPEEVLAQTPEEVLAPASLELAREVLAEELAKEQVEERDLFWWRTLELENICKDGSTVWLEVKVTALRDEDKRIVGILGISRDISERKRAEEALQEAREELESRVEHRMRRGSPYGLTFRELTVLHLVVAGKSDKEIAATLGISTLTASKHLANILHKMGAASRTEAGVRAVREGLLD